MKLPDWSPIILTQDEFLKSRENLEEQYGKLELLDSYENQAKELFKLKNIGKPADDARFKNDVSQYISENTGTYIFFPWLRKVVRILQESDFIKVRTDRNRNKITTEEQLLLAEKNVGIIGMSVGRAVATTMALERIFSELRIADFDTLDLSNLNRLKAPIYDLGLPKVVSVAREIFTIDPYLNLKIFPEGATKDNLHGYLTVGGHLNAIVDECDSLEIKIMIRQYAKKLGIPVIMETSDRGMLDIERFDLEPERPIFHGLLEEFDLDSAMTNPAEKWQVLMKLVDFQNLSERAKSSMAEIGKTLHTWPQLASAVVHGGGAVTEVTRRILLGEDMKSGRYYIDMEAIIKQ